MKYFFVFLVTINFLVYSAADGIAQADAVEVAYWNSIQGSKNAKKFDAYLKKYPKGHFADLAQIELNDLRLEKKRNAVDDNSIHHRVDLTSFNLKEGMKGEVPHFLWFKEQLDGDLWVEGRCIIITKNWSSALTTAAVSFISPDGGKVSAWALKKLAKFMANDFIELISGGIKLLGPVSPLNDATCYIEKQDTKSCNNPRILRLLPQKNYDWSRPPGKAWEKSRLLWELGCNRTSAHFGIKIQLYGKDKKPIGGIRTFDPCKGRKDCFPYKESNSETRGLALCLESLKGNKEADDEKNWRSLVVAFGTVPENVRKEMDKKASAVGKCDKRTI